MYGGDGFSSAYWSQKNGARIFLLVDRGTMTAEGCPKQPVGQGTGEPVTCERDGDVWYRTSGGQHEYAVPEDDLVVRISGDTARVDRDVLHAAAEAAHRRAGLPPAASAPRGTTEARRPATDGGRCAGQRRGDRRLIRPRPARTVTRR